MKADLILTGGRIYPLGRFGLLSVSDLAVAGGRVMAVGGGDIFNLRGRQTRVMALEGQTVLPGFNDAHAHIVYTGLSSFGVLLGSCRSIGEILARISHHAARLEPGEWLLGRGYAAEQLKEKRPPLRSELDSVLGGRPGFIDDRGGHARVANSAALAAAGVDSTTLDPPGGSIGRTADGVPTGLLLEAAMRLVADRQPAPSLARRRNAILRSQRLLLSRGITSVGAAVNRGFADDLRAYQQLADARRLRLRVTQFLSWELLEAARGLGIASGFGGPLVRAGPVKVFVDGGAAGGAALRNGSGVWRTTPGELRRIVHQAQEGGLQVAAHAIGDAAIAAMLDAVEACGSEARRSRHRIEHCTVCPPDLRQNAAELGVVAVMQPLLATRRSWVAERLGVGPADIAPHRSLAATGVPLAFSSDLPVVPDPDPWPGIWAVVKDGAERLSLLRALRAYTAGGAFATFSESSRGSLEPNRLADFQVYAGDPFRPGIQPAKKNRPALVALGGVPVYRSRTSL